MTTRTSHLRLPLGLGAFLLAGAMLIGSSYAAEPIETSAKEAYVVDFQTGAVMLDKNGDEIVQPASMSKLMTLYLLFEHLKNGKISLEDTLPVSEKAWALNEGSTMFVGINSRIRVEDLIRGIIVQSGNDACLVIAEGLAGSEEAFAEQMTKEAKEIGLTHSHFVNSHGLEAPGQEMTAHDLAILAKHIISDFPEYYHYFSEKEFTFNGIKQGNRNPLLYHEGSGVDGLKTGHLSVSGYGVTVSAVRDGRRVIVVLHGMTSMQARADESSRVLDWAFHAFENDKLVAAGQPIDEAPVWLGQTETVPLVTGGDLVATLPRGSRDQMKVVATFDGPIPAPIAKGQQVGTITVSAPGLSPTEVPLLAGTDVPRLGPVGRAYAALKHLLLGS